MTTPILLIIDKNRAVLEAFVCRDGGDLEIRFETANRQHGRETNAEEMDNGSVTLEDGTSIIMTWAQQSDATDPDDEPIVVIGDQTVVWCCQCNAMVDAEIVSVDGDKIGFICENNHQFTHQ